jgi:hypothetical protein
MAALCGPTACGSILTASPISSAVKGGCASASSASAPARPLCPHRRRRHAGAPMRSPARPRSHHPSAPGREAEAVAPLPLAALRDRGRGADRRPPPGLDRIGDLIACRARRSTAASARPFSPASTRLWAALPSPFDPLVPQEPALAPFSASRADRDRRSDRAGARRSDGRASSPRSRTGSCGKAGPTPLRGSTGPSRGASARPRHPRRQAPPPPLKMKIETIEPASESRRCARRRRAEPLAPSDRSAAGGGKPEPDSCR